MNQMQWTPADEQHFAELSDRRNTVLKERERAIVAVVNRIFTLRDRVDEAPLMIEMMKTFAKEIRDALAPYDDGQRPIVGPIAEGPPAAPSTFDRPDLY